MIPVRARLHHSRLQSGHRHQLDHRLQHQHPAAERALRRRRPLGLRRIHDRQFRRDLRRRRAGRSKGPQVPALGRHRGNHRVADLHRRAFSRTENVSASMPRARSSPWSLPDQKARSALQSEAAGRLAELQCDASTESARPTSLVVIYSYGDFRAASQVVRSDDPAAKPIEITREAACPANKVVAFFSNPFGDLDAARTAPLKIENALITPVPSAATAGW